MSMSGSYLLDTNIIIGLFADEEAVPWKQANETVYRRGGWRAYAKEAAEGSKSAPSTPGGADPHAGHSMPRPMPTPKKEQP